MASLIENSDFQDAIDATPGHVFVRQAVVFAFRFFAEHWMRIAGVVWFPLVLAWAVLYFAVDFYLAQLMLFLTTPDSHTASLALGVLTAGIFAALFLHAVMIVALSEILLGHRLQRWFYFRAVRMEWRLYAGVLRELLIMAVGATAIAVAVYEASMFFDMRYDWVRYVTGLAVVLTAVGFAIRPGLLIPAVAMLEHGQIIRRGWTLSAGRFAPLAAIVVILILPGLMLQAAGDHLLRAIHPQMMTVLGASLGDVTANFRPLLSGFLLTTTISFEITTVLVTAASFFVYRALAPVGALQTH